ncbi:MAG TPA: hypothetical protein VLR89_01620 [Anaerolineaceae bacterium]|nr:hypothetical protein [Anaerolineaceae bacterium]
MEDRQEIIQWLLDSDPSIRWQVQRDLLCEPEVIYKRERAKLQHTGWSAEVLKQQDPDGLWNQRLYIGKWISTTYTLYLLKLLGLPPGHLQALRGCEQLLNQGLYQGEKIRYWQDESVEDLAVTSLVVSVCSYFHLKSEPLERVAEYLARHQASDGCWCMEESLTVRDYNFETTLLALDALLQFTRLHPRQNDALMSSAIERGQNYLLDQQLGIAGGKALKQKWTSFSFPAYWHYDVLTALDYFRESKADKDIRFQPAIDLLLAKQNRDGKWALGNRHHGKTYIEMEEGGAPSRWNTLRALRVLKWWYGE